MRQYPQFVFWFFAIGLAFIGVIAALAVRAARKRTGELAAVAQQIGFSFVGNSWNGPVLSPLVKTSLLQRTRGKFCNAMTGSAGGLQTSLFDYNYGQGKSNVTLTLACFSQNVELPPFELRPEGVLDRISDVIVHSDIDFDSHPEFSRRYLLRSPDEAGTRKLFAPGLLTYMEQIPSDKKWHIEANGMNLIVYRGGFPVKPQEIPAFLSETSAIARTIFASAGVRVAGM